MKLIIVVFAVLFVLKINGQSSSVKPENPSKNSFWSQPDKKMHFIATISISTATYTFLATHPTYKDFSPLKKRVISFTSAMLAGLIKETIDSRTKSNHFSSGDLFADLSGAFAFQASATIPLNFKKKKDPNLLSAN